MSNAKLDAAEQAATAPRSPNPVYEAALSDPDLMMCAGAYLEHEQRRCRAEAAAAEAAAAASASPTEKRWKVEFKRTVTYSCEGAVKASSAAHAEQLVREGALRPGGCRQLDMGTLALPYPDRDWKAVVLATCWNPGDVGGLSTVVTEVPASYRQPRD